MMRSFLPLRLAWRCLVAAACVLLAQCAHRPETSVTPGRIEWQMAGQEPLTYCPKGRPPPVSGSGEAGGVEYVYLADRRTRFYIPRDCQEHRRQALEMKEASESSSMRAKKRLRAMTEPVAGLLGFYLLGLPDALGATPWSDAQRGADTKKEPKAR